MSSILFCTLKKKVEKRLSYSSQNDLAFLMLFFCFYQYTSGNLYVLVLSSCESEPGDGQCVGGGGRDGDHQLSGEEQ